MEKLTKITDVGALVLVGDESVYPVECYDCCLDKKDAKKLLKDAITKLAEYEDLEEQGKLSKLPCAVGDKIYLPNKYVGKVIDFEIIEVCIFKEEIMFIDDSENEYFIYDFEKTVFLTKEAAETALKEMNE